MLGGPVFPDQNYEMTMPYLHISLYSDGSGPPKDRLQDSYGTQD